MNASSQPSRSSASSRVQDAVREPMDLTDDDDFAIGWECANPALQIEVWDREADAQPFRMFA